MGLHIWRRKNEFVFSFAWEMASMRNRFISSFVFVLDEFCRRRGAKKIRERGEIAIWNSYGANKFYGKCIAVDSARVALTSSFSWHARKFMLSLRFFIHFGMCLRCCTIFSHFDFYRYARCFRETLLVIGVARGLFSSRNEMNKPRFLKTRVSWRKHTKTRSAPWTHRWKL